jgi:anhydro-N-acetylmuramic acid kinase
MFERFNQQYIWSLGIMSGTSLDAIDMAILKTDGKIVVEQGHAYSIPMQSDLQQDLRGLMQGHGDFLAIEKKYSRAVADSVLEFIAKFSDSPRPDVIGLHGQTIIHRPSEGITWQLGNPNMVAQLTGISVVSDFRRRDMAAGGQGAPLVPLYHAALAEILPKPLAIVNIGGVANVTYVGEHELLAFDVGTGNALLNDFVMANTGEQYDDGGRYAAAGAIHENIVEGAMSHAYFSAPPPKSLDRNDFNLQMVEGLGLHDGAATLMQFTAGGILKAQDHFPKPVQQWVICGGGVHNTAMMKSLAAQLSQPVILAEYYGWRSDAIEAEAFAFLAVRSLRGLPLSLPSTTGVKQAVTGGVFCQ